MGGRSRGPRTAPGTRSASLTASSASTTPAGCLFARVMVAIISSRVVRWRRQRHEVRHQRCGEACLLPVRELPGELRGDLQAAGGSVCAGPNPLPAVYALRRRSDVCGPVTDFAVHWSTLRRWTLATIGYCHICRERTTQHDLHEIRADELLHLITTECSKCGSITARQRLPSIPGTPTSPPKLHVVR